MEIHLLFLSWTCPSHLTLASLTSSPKHLLWAVPLMYPFLILSILVTLQENFNILTSATFTSASSLVPSLNFTASWSHYCLLHLSLHSCQSPFITHHTWHISPPTLTYLHTLLRLFSTLSVALYRWPYKYLKCFTFFKYFIFKTASYVHSLYDQQTNAVNMHYCLCWQWCDLCKMKNKCHKVIFVECGKG